MLAGDVVIGRFVPEALRDRLILPLRILLAVPFLFFGLRPALALACVLAAVAAFGYPAALPLQERLVDNTEPDVIGQVFGLAGTGTMIGQSAGALIAGLLADVLGNGNHAAATTMTVMAVLSLLATALLVGGLRRSDQAIAEAA
jgi:predicted MFS family arabinose efflux permease